LMGRRHWADDHAFAGQDIRPNPGDDAGRKCTSAAVEAVGPQVADNSRNARAPDRPGGSTRCRAQHTCRVRVNGRARPRVSAGRPPPATWIELIAGVGRPARAAIALGVACKSRDEVGVGRGMKAGMGPSAVYGAPQIWGIWGSHHGVIARCRLRPTRKLSIPWGCPGICLRRSAA